MGEQLQSSLNIIAGSAAQLPEGRVFALDQQTLVGTIIQIINIIILAVILYKVLYQPVKNLLNQRTNKIQDQFKELEKREEKAQSLIDEYQSKLGGIEEEGEKLIREARGEALSEKTRIIESAEKEAEKIKADAQKAMETERQLLQRDMRDYIIEMSTALTEKTLEDSVNPKILQDQLEEGLKDLEVSSWEN